MSQHGGQQRLRRTRLNHRPQAHREQQPSLNQTTHGGRSFLSLLRPWLRQPFWLLVLAGLLTFLAPATHAISLPSTVDRPVAQATPSAPPSPMRRSPAVVAEQVYQQMPELPLENQYISEDTGEVATTNTLMFRFISYHTVTKFRPPNYRLDWKLTLADYLGVNERISPSAYPGSSTLKTNPLPGDIAVIQRLNRQQRDRLVNLLVSIYTQPSP